MSERHTRGVLEHSPNWPARAMAAHAIVGRAIVGRACKGGELNFLMGADLGTVGTGISGGARGCVPPGGGVVAPLAEPPGPAVGATTAVRRGALERARTAVLVAMFWHVPFPQERAVSWARLFALRPSRLVRFYGAASEVASPGRLSWSSPGDSCRSLI